MAHRALLMLTAAAACACASYDVIEDVSYDERHGEATTLDIYLPSPRTPNTPLIMMIHGGGWSLGSKRHFDDHGPRLAHAGYAVASINYRLVPDGAYPLLFQDVFCALGFLQDNADEYSIDPTQIGVTGYSAGGHLASLLGTAEPTGDFEPDCGHVPAFRPAAVVSGAGPTDLSLYPDTGSIRDLLGGTLKQVPDVYERASPVTHVSADDPPFLLIYGSDDLFVPFEHAEVMHEALEEVGNDVRLMRIRGAGHLLNPGADLYDAVIPIVSADTPEAWAAMLDFFDDHLERP